MESAAGQINGLLSELCQFTGQLLQVQPDSVGNSAAEQIQGAFFRKIREQNLTNSGEIAGRGKTVIEAAVPAVTIGKLCFRAAEAFLTAAGCGQKSITVPFL